LNRDEPTRRYLVEHPSDRRFENSNSGPPMITGRKIADSSTGFAQLRDWP
jgi:hypothetical protein